MNDIPKETMALAEQAEKYAVKLTTTFVIKAPEQMVEAGGLLQEIKTKLNLLEETRKSMTRPLDDSKKRIMDFFKKPVLMLQEAENSIKKAMLVYQQEQELKRQAEEKKLREAAAKEEAKQKAALEKKAAAAAAKGNLEKAEELKQQAAEVFVPAPVLAKEEVKVEGVSTRTVWTYEITDVNSIPRDYMIPDEKKIGAMVKASGGTLTIPGIRIYQEQIIAARRA